MTARRAIRTTSTRMIGRLLGRLRDGGRRRPGAAGARLRHQWLDPRAVLPVRRFRPEADLRPAVARARRFRSSPASTISARSRAASAISPLATTRCRARTRSIPRQTPRPLEPTLARARRRRLAACGSRRLGGYFAQNAEPDAFAAVERVAEALGAAATVELPEAARAPRRGLSHHDDRGRGAASRPAARRAPPTTTPTCATA